MNSAGRTQGLRGSIPLLVAGFVIFFVCFGGVIDTVSVFLNALAQAEGWSRKSLSAGISIGAITAGLSTPAVGVLIDRCGVRLPMILGIVMLGLGFGLLMEMTQPWQFLAANALLGPGFAFCAMLPVTVAVTVEVRHRKALALGIVGVGSSLGALVLAPVLQRVVDAVGWRQAYVWMGAAVVLIPLPFVLFAMPRGRLRQREPLGAAIAAPPRGLWHDLLRPGVGALCGVLIVPGLANFGIQVHLVPFLVDAGYTSTTAASALGVMIGISAAGKLLGGFVADRIGTLRTLRLAIALEALGAVLLLWVGIPLALAGFTLALGLAGGTQAAVVPVVALRVLGEERFGTLYGILQLSSVLTVGLAPIIPGAIFDARSSYDLAVLFWLAVLALAVAIVFRLRLPAERGSPAQ